MTINGEIEDDKDEATTSVGKTSERQRMKPTKMHTFEGINEESDEASSDGSERLEETKRDKETAKRTEETQTEGEGENKENSASEGRDTEQTDKPELPAVRRTRMTSETGSNGDEVEPHQRSILKGSNLRLRPPVMDKHLAFDETDKPKEDTEKTGQNGDDKKNDDNDDQHAIDKYYEKNQYSITGNYAKNNQDTLNKIPERMRRSRAASTVSASQKSRKSMMSNKSLPPLATPESTQRKFHKTWYWLAHNHKRIGFRHICMVVIMFLYTFLGATIFWLIETRNEQQLVTERKTNIDAAIRSMAEDMLMTVNDPDQRENTTAIENFIRKAYIRLLDEDTGYKGTTLYKAEDPDNNFKWTYASSFFFSMNVYTTTGYGSIAPETYTGKAVVIVYGFLFVPLTLVIIRDLGQFTLVHLTKLYARLLVALRRARGICEGKDDEYIMLPIKLCLFLMFMYILLMGLFIYEYDALSGPPGSGMDLFNCVYFSFISFTTIGLGDIMPNNIPFAPIVSILFFFGMPVMKVVNRVTYISLENGVFGTLTVLENRLFGIDMKSVSPVPDDKESAVVPQREPSIRSMRREEDDSSDEEGDIPNEWINNFTIRSIATFMKSNGDVYGGGFGRVNLRRGDLIGPSESNQNTLRSISTPFPPGRIPPLPDSQNI